MQTQKLLIVDDEIDVCDFVKNFFEERGLKVLAALNGAEAVSIFQKERPDLILLDIKMKGLDGIATLRQIREIDNAAKVIMVTALHDQDRLEESYKYGAIDYITKPLILDNLEEAVAKNLGSREDRAETI